MINSYGKGLFILKLLFMHQVMCLPLNNDTHLIYDQRQTGKYNIQISLSDVAIIKVDQNDFSDDSVSDADEYYYDDADLTINPISNWIISNTTNKTPQKSTSPKNELIDIEVEGNNDPESFSLTHVNTSTLESVNESSNLSSNTSFLSHVHKSIIGETLAKEPVLVSSQRKTPANKIRLLTTMQMQNARHKTKTMPNEFRGQGEKMRFNSTILNVLSVPPVLLNNVGICSRSQIRDVNGNCRRKRPTFLKRLLGMLNI